MNAALEPSPDATPALAGKRLLNVDEYHRMAEVGILAPDERVELIEGEIVTMPPVGPAHAHLVDHLNELITVIAVGRAIVRVQGPVRLSNLSEPEPDLALLRHRPDRYAKVHPAPGDTLLAIEVSDSTLVRDTRIKVPLYARHGIPELWLLDVRHERLVVYREPDGDGYAREFAQRPPEPLAPVAFPDMTIDLSRLFDAG